MTPSAQLIEAADTHTVKQRAYRIEASLRLYLKLQVQLKHNSGSTLFPQRCSEASRQSPLSFDCSRGFATTALQSSSLVEAYKASNTQSCDFTGHFAATVLTASLRLHLLLRCDCTKSFKYSRSESLTTLKTLTLTPEPLGKTLR